MSTENSQESPAATYHQALRAFHRRELGFLIARKFVNNTPPLHYELYPAQNRVVLYATLESTSQHENSQENHSIQQAGRISQHEAPHQSTLPQSSAPSSIKKRFLGKADFAANGYTHDIRVAVQPHISIESYMNCFHKDDTEQNIPGPYEAFQTPYSPPQPYSTSYGPLQDAYLQDAGAGQGGFGLRTPSPPLNAFGELSFSLYHPAQHTD